MILIDIVAREFQADHVKPGLLRVVVLAVLVGALGLSGIPAMAATGSHSARVATSSRAVASSQIAASRQDVPRLGKFHLFGPNSKGFGRRHPVLLNTGGDPSGIVEHITWTSWGASQSYGWGGTFIFRPGGGFYDKQVRILLSATNLGRCSMAGPPAYTSLWARVPSRPGGPLGPWFRWASHSMCTVS